MTRRNLRRWPAVTLTCLLAVTIAALSVRTIRAAMAGDICKPE